MKVGIIGLGRMGFAVAERLSQAGYSVEGYDRDERIRKQAQKASMTVAMSLEQLIQENQILWIMIPAGDPVEQVLSVIKRYASKHTIVVDAGNSKFSDSMRRSKELASHNVSFLDCGVSGGIHGRTHGFSLMIGGSRSIFEQLVGLFQAIAVKDGYAYVGPSGAGHYVKMVHNGIEYALLQAYAEGLQLITEGTFKDDQLDLQEITRVWMHGSIIRSWILDLAHTIFSREIDFDAISGEVDATGMGSWTVEEADQYHVPVQLIKDAVAIRTASHVTKGNFATKLVALLRHEFGGHAFYSKKNS
ncbi:MAG: decarboxylating 6-phosphogluconate dehydrogenase [Candidatus Babeliales bacterium]